MKFITMEYIEGKDLRTIIYERGKLPPEEVVDIIAQVCRALDAAHSVGVIHRDLKPQNIMRDQNGRILVMDFGLARTLEGDGMTMSGALVGHDGVHVAGAGAVEESGSAVGYLFARPDLLRTSKRGVAFPRRHRAGESDSPDSGTGNSSIAVYE